MCNVEYYLYVFLITIQVGQKESIIRELMALSTSPKKHFGQNFLTDVETCRQIIRNIPLNKGEQVIEIGPGLGILTEQLLISGYLVKAIEIDPDMIDHLRGKLCKKYPGKLEMINEDILKFINSGNIGPEDVLISNLPYNISSNFMGHLLDSIDLENEEHIFKGAIIMFQSEFASRLISSPKTKEYGKISVMFQAKTEYRKIFDVHRSKFYPEPKVNGTIIYFNPKKVKGNIPKNDRVFRSIVTVLFLNRRKKIKNSLTSSSIGLNIPDENIKTYLLEIGISDRRPEELTPAEFIDLTNGLIAISDTLKSA